MAGPSVAVIVPVLCGSGLEAQNKEEEVVYTTFNVCTSLFQTLVLVGKECGQADVPALKTNLPKFPFHLHQKCCLHMYPGIVLLHTLNEIHREQHPTYKPS